MGSPVDLGGGSELLLGFNQLEDKDFSTTCDLGVEIVANMEDSQENSCAI